MNWTNKEDGNRHQLQAKPLEKVKAFIESEQRNLADYLSLKAQEMSGKTKRMSLLCFCLLFGGCSISIILYSSFSMQPLPVMHRITIPTYSLQPSPVPMHSDSMISKNEYARINHFRQYLLELQKDSSGKKRYDSIMQARPHLLDSIHFIDSLFQAQ